MERTAAVIELQNYLDNLLRGVGYKASGTTGTDKPTEYLTDVHLAIISFHNNELLDVRIYKRAALNIVCSFVLPSVKDFMDKDMLSTIKHFL